LILTEGGDRRLKTLGLSGVGSCHPESTPGFRPQAFALFILRGDEEDEGREQVGVDDPADLGAVDLEVLQCCTWSA
jgi:hypothetical protein